MSFDVVDHFLPLGSGLRRSTQIIPFVAHLIGVDGSDAAADVVARYQRVNKCSERSGICDDPWTLHTTYKHRLALRCVGYCPRRREVHRPLEIKSMSLRSCYIGVEG